MNFIATAPVVLLRQTQKRVVFAVGLALSLMACFPVAAQTPAIVYTPVVTTYAGGATSSTLCSNATDTIGDGCVATSAILNQPISGDVDAAGNIYFPDAIYNVVRRIDATTGVITLVAGQISSTSSTPVCSGALDPVGDGCPATQATFNGPRCVHIDRGGNIIVADTTNNLIRSINKTTGIVTVLMGEYGKVGTTPPANTAPVTPTTQALDNPYYMIFDPAGNMMVTSASANYIPIAIAINGLIDPVSSVVYDLAGTGGKKAGGGNGGLATAAEFDGTRGIALDAAENVYIADYESYQVRRVTSPGAKGQVTLANINAATISSYAGTTEGVTGNGGLATVAELDPTQAVDFDNAGSALVMTSSSNTIRIINPTSGIINSYAGTGTGSYTGDGGPIATATFNVPLGVKVNLGGRETVFDESNARIRNIYPTPFFSPLAVGNTSVAQNVSMQAAVAVTPSTAVLSNPEFTVGTPSGCTLGTAMTANAYCSLPVKFAPAGPGLRPAQLKVTDSNGNVYADAVLGVGLAPAAAFYGATISTLAGNGTAGSTGNGAAATSALVSAPRGGAFDSIGNFYFADSANNIVREISKKTGAIAVVAGTGTSGSTGAGGAATAAELNTPTGVAVDPAGNLYIADSGNNRIQEVSASTGIITTIAGTGTPGYTGDTGLATAATLNDPTGIAIDSVGILYIADTGNNALRAFSPAGGVIVTLAGTGTAGYAGDGGVAQMAQLNAPVAVTVDIAGNIYVADTGNNVVRRIVPVVSGIINFQANISTYAGLTGGNSNSGDGGPATAAYLLKPSGLGVDAAGDLYIAAGGQVRMISSSSGTITTVAGFGVSGSYSGEGGSALAAVLPAPAQNLTVDQVGNIYLSDTAGNRIVEIAGSSAASIVFGSQTIATTSSPQSVTLYNSGNEPLTLTNIAVPAGFALSSSASNACASTTALAAGASCTLTVTFSPTSATSYSSQIVITDNALNNVTSTQVISLTGTGVTHLDATTTAVTFSPTNPTYGQTVMVTAAVTGGANPSGQVNLVINSKTTVTVTLGANGQATYALTGLSAGTDTVTANYLGDSINADSSGSASVIVEPAVLTVTANNISIYPTQAIPTLTYTITGFVYGESAATATTGNPVLSTSAASNSAVGTYPITVAQGTFATTNYTFTFVPGTLTVLSPTFTITLSSSSITVPSSKIGQITVTINPSIDYSGTIKLGCGPLPKYVVCTFVPASVQVNGAAATATLNISTNNFMEISSLNFERRSHGPLARRSLLSLAFTIPFLSLALFGSTRTRRCLLLRGLIAILLFSAIQGLNGCSTAAQDALSSSSSITIIGTDANNSTAQTNLALTIN